MSRKIHNPLILLEASTGIEPVYTDLQWSVDLYCIEIKRLNVAYGSMCIKMRKSVTLDLT